MLKLTKIISVLGVKKVIGSDDWLIQEPIQLDAGNEREDVIMWAGEKYYETLKKICHGVIICQDIAKEDIKDSCCYLIVENPRYSFRVLLDNFFVKKPRYNTIAKTSIISPLATIGDDIIIGENVVIEDDVVIGNRVIIGHNSVIKKRTIIGSNVSIGMNNSIGGVGFGYEKDELGNYVLIPHIGNVVIEDFVEIGNNTCIDRAVLGSTILRENVKIDNLVHIAHGVKIGYNSMIIANAMVAGSVEIGRNVWVAPSASIINKRSIGGDAIVGIGAVILKDVLQNEIVVGNPGRVIKK